MLPEDDFLSLALLYHLNSEPRLKDDDLIERAYEVEYKQIAAREPTIMLPRAKVNSPLAGLVARRQSNRNYALTSMQANVLSSILLRTYSLNMDRKHAGSDMFSRTVPSAGGLYPLEVYVAVERVDNLQDGLYHYNIMDHGLELMRKGKILVRLGDIALGQDILATANIVFIFSAVFARTLRKYGPRGYRYVLFEAGHAAQNCCLAATEYDLGSLCIGGFKDSLLNSLIEVDGFTEAAVYCVAVGYPEDKSS